MSNNPTNDKKDIDSYLESVIEYLNTDSNDVTKLVTWVEINLKSYITDQILSNEPEILSYLSAEFKTNIEHALGYLKTVDDPLFVNVQDAIEKGNLLIAEQNALVVDDEEARELEVVLNLSDGFKVVNLTTTKQLKREGKMMNHCVGNDNQMYIDRVARRMLQIWSLRDAENNPWCTIEYTPSTREIGQIRGRENQPVLPEYIPYCKELFRNQVIDNRVDYFNNREMLNIGITVSWGERPDFTV
jgi:hypothetical protein